MFAVVELVLGSGAFGLGWLLYHGGVTWGALSKHSVYFAGGAAVLGVIFVVGGLRRLLRSSS